MIPSVNQRGTVAVLPTRHRVVFLLLLLSIPAFAAITEPFEWYLPPQVAGMGGAITADATGYLANYYNPAALAKNPRKKKEYIPIDLEGTLGASAIGASLSAKSFGIYRLFDTLKQNSNSYTYFNFASVPAVSFRNFCFSILANYRFAGISDGTTVDVDSVADLGANIGFGTNLANNYIKLGAVAKVVVRNELKGQYAHTALGSDDEIQSLMTEGLGYGVDLGGLVTLPMRYLPAFGFVWKDFLNTRFTQFSLFNGSSSGVPQTVRQAINMAVSIHPIIGKRLKSTFAFEVKRVMNPEIPLAERLYAGVQIEEEKKFYIWFGMNQLFNPTAGVALRLPGGNLELATYGQIYDGTNSDRRFMMRYTISW